MNKELRDSLRIAAHVILALWTGAILCICAVLLLLDSPSGLLNTGTWMDDPAPKYGLAILTAALSPTRRLNPAAGSSRTISLSLRAETVTDLFPAMAMVLLTLISNSFGTGIAGGLLVHVIVQVLAGKAREIPIGLFILAVPLGYYFYTASTH